VNNLTAAIPIFEGNELIYSLAVSGEYCHGYWHGWHDVELGKQGDIIIVEVDKKRESPSDYGHTHVKWIRDGGGQRVNSQLTAELREQRDLLEQINKVSKAILRDMREISQFAARGSRSAVDPNTTWTRPPYMMTTDPGPTETKDGEQC
jgi:hypothetical protein